MEKIEEKLPVTILEKLKILTDAAKYDVACTSSGVSRKGGDGSLGNTVASGVCHCFSADGRCISLLKILLTNECIYDCKYCVNRSSRDTKRVEFTPEEVAELTIGFYKRNYIEGLFLSSGIHHNPDYTMERMYESLYLIRKKHHFNGYIHVKAIPGADPVLIEQTGYLADRMSINLELPTAEGLRMLAPHKNRKNILTPMRQIQLGIQRNQQFHGIEEQVTVPGKLPDGSDVFLPEKCKERPAGSSLPSSNSKTEQAVARERRRSRLYVPAGQSTQMIVGATKENDYQMIKVAESLYQKFGLKRVFYSAFVNTTKDSMLPVLEDGPPLLREHRLYQADFLMRFYGFGADEILSEERPNFNVFFDPKCNWALGHLEHFPIEINQASYAMLLRVPGIGVKSARRIMAARRHSMLDFQDLKKLGVVLKRAVYFITCRGKQYMRMKLEEDYITRELLAGQRKAGNTLERNGNYQQLSFFDAQGKFGLQDWSQGGAG